MHDWRGWLLPLVGGLVGCVLTGCSSSHSRADSERLVNDTAATVTVRVIVPIVGESTQGANALIQERGCRPPIDGCAFLRRVLAPGNSVVIGIPTTFTTSPRQLVVTSRGGPQRCTPLEPVPAAATDPTFTVSDITSTLC